MRKKLLKWVVVLIGLTIIIFHIVWYYNYSLYKRFIEGMEELEKFTTYLVQENDYIYHVKFPSYPTFTGNLSIAAVDAEGSNEYSLIIWPSRFAATEYGVSLPMDEESFAQVMIKKDLKAYDIYDQVLVDENKGKIEALFQEAEKRWGKL